MTILFSLICLAVSYDDCLLVTQIRFPMNNNDLVSVELKEVEVSNTLPIFPSA